MGRKSTVDKLPDEQFDFVIRAILSGATDREISTLFKAEFKKDLPKSSLNTWRNKAGNELAERYRLRRFQVRTFVETLKAEGVDVGDDKYARSIENVEDQLLTNERDLINADPVKLLALRQVDEKLRVRREQLEINRQKLAFDRSKHDRESAVRLDRLKIAADVWQYILFWFNQNEPHIADGLTRNSEKILTGIETHLQDEAA